ncbi:MAG: hypothetical protein ABIJ96_10445 [Elusimicrobiota bacterium]
MTEEHPFKKKVQVDILQKLCDATSPHIKVDGFITMHMAEGVKEPGLSKQEVFVHACHGAISAMVLMDQKLPESASQIIKAAADAASRIGADQMETMTWAMEGIAKVTPGLKPADVAAISAAIDSDYHGAGPIFNELCAKAKG